MQRGGKPKPHLSRKTKSRAFSNRKEPFGNGYCVQRRHNLRPETHELNAIPLLYFPEKYRPATEDAQQLLHRLKTHLFGDGDESPGVVEDELAVSLAETGDHQVVAERRPEQVRRLYLLDEHHALDLLADLGADLEYGDVGPRARVGAVDDGEPVATWLESERAHPTIRNNRGTKYVKTEM